VFYVTRASGKDEEWLEKNLSQVSNQEGRLLVCGLAIADDEMGTPGNH